MQFKDQICNNLVKNITQSKHMPTARIVCSVAYSSYIYGEHASPVISITHTRCGKDTTDIPKETEDPTTSGVRQRKISRDTSHAMQGAIIFGDDIAESIVLTMVIKVIIPTTAKEMP